MHATRQRSARVAGLLALASLAVALGGCRGTRSAKPPIHPNPNMDNVTRIEAQEPSDFWHDRRGMRPQVEGTVAQNELRDDDHLYRGQIDGAWAATLPAEVPLNAETLERGQERYGIYCTPCHGNAGLANGGIVPTRGTTNPDWAWEVVSLHGDAPRGYAIGQLYDVIANGVRTMPGYAHQIPVEDRWAIATYVRALQVAYEVPLDYVPQTVRREQGWQ